MEAIQDTIAQVGASLHQRMDQFESELKNSSNPTTVATLAADFTAFKVFVAAALRSLQLQSEMIASAVDQIEMRSRRKILLLHGVPESNEDTASVVCNTLVSKLKLSGFKVSDINRCHRMGRLTTADRPRPILFKLGDIALRSKIWGSKSSLKGTGITLSEFLTKSRHELFLAARERFGVSKCWTKEGTVYVVSSDGTRHRISSLQDLDLKQPDTSKQPPAAKECTAAPALKPRRAASVTSKK